MNTIWLAVALTLCVSCAAPAGQLVRGEDSAAEIARAVLDAQADGGDYALLGEEDRDFYLETVYGLPQGSWREAAVYAAGGVDARELAVVRCDGASIEAVSAALEDYRADRAGDFVGYAPGQAALVEGGGVWTGEDVAVLAICTDTAAVQAALTGVAERAVPKGVKLDTTGFVPFTPPRENDMTIYDTTAVKAAWARRDPSGLSEKDAALYARCGEIFDQAIVPGMSQFERELALHDWLAEHAAYDRSHYDPATPNGRPGSLEPYGPLVNGTGICLGYATAFQLLMDLAGVECITVVGASANSTLDHAWNMVRLEGEWYCVDPTWDDPTDYTGEVSRVRYRYFNVTSDHMRKTNHQWDYGNIPEAAATRFRWDGTGPLPQ